METIIAIMLLLLPSAILGIKNSYEYGAFPSFGLAQKSIIILLAFYTFSIMLLGAEKVQGGHDLLNSFYLRKLSVFFFFPGLGAAIILFPKVAAEYLGDHDNVTSSSTLEIFSATGWLVLFVSVLSALMWH